MSYPFDYEREDAGIDILTRYDRECLLAIEFGIDPWEPPTGMHPDAKAFLWWLTIAIAAAIALFII
jgi:hypothetical protein